MSKFFPRKQMQSKLRMTDAEFDSAVKGLLKKGLMEESTIDGEIHYRITDLGSVVQNHSDSDPAKRN
jgi:hypothetical protein